MSVDTVPAVPEVRDPAYATAACLWAESGR